MDDTQPRFPSKKWCFTSFEEEPPTLGEARYLIYGKEICPTTQKPHWQCFIYFYTNRRFSALKKLFPTAHIEPARGTCEEAADYCKKDGEWFEFGSFPITPKRKGEIEKTRWADALLAAKESRFDDIPADIFLRNYRTCKQISTDYMKQPEPLDKPCGIWYYGLAGAGKTTKARLSNPGAFIKSRDKWWDGYRDQDVVICDDLDKYNVALAGYLKDWGDMWPFKAEVKGGTRFIRPKRFIITSQYRPSQIWDDAETLAAIERRYDLIEVVKDF